jgi:type II pantothenate kinase
MRKLYACTIDTAVALPDGVRGIDAGLTLTKVVQVRAGRLDAFAVETQSTTALALVDGETTLGVTGARGAAYAREGATVSQEIDAAAIGAKTLLAAEGDFVLALLGTGTAFAAVRAGAAGGAGGDKVTHLGGTPLGGGSFAGIARRIEPSLTYEAMIAGAARGDRTRSDVMVSDAYPEGIGRIGGTMTAAHLAKAAGSLDDVLAALLNLHGENIAQIGASRALIAQIRTLVLAGGFAQENAALVASISAMAALFGVETHLAPHPGFAGALGAALAAVRG